METNDNGTRIDDLLKNNNGLTNEEETIVDSIISDLNSNSKTTSQEKLPQISNEEKEQLMRQREYQEQQKKQYQIAQLQRQQQQQQQQYYPPSHPHQHPHPYPHPRENMMNVYSKVQQGKGMLSKNILDYLSKILPDLIIIIILFIVLNIDTFSNFLSFKSIPFLFNIDTNKSTISAIILKGFILALLYAIIKYFIK